MDKSFRLSDYSITYSTRTRADEIADNLNKYINTLSEDDKLIIDFSGVKAISYSFLDQLLSKVSMLSLLKEERVFISGWSKELFPVITESLDHRSYRRFTSSKSASTNDKEQLLICQS